MHCLCNIGGGIKLTAAERRPWCASQAGTPPACPPTPRPSLGEAPSQEFASHQLHCLACLCTQLRC